MFLLTHVKNQKFNRNIMKFSKRFQTFSQICDRPNTILHDSAKIIPKSRDLRHGFLYEFPLRLLSIDPPALFEIPRTKPLSLFEFLSIKISLRPSLSHPLCVHRLVRKSNGLWARSATRAETCIQTCTHAYATCAVNARSPDATVFGWQANFFHYSTCISVFQLCIQESYCCGGGGGKFHRAISAL